MASTLLDRLFGLMGIVFAWEPLWALVFSWLPLLSGVKRENLIALAASKLTRPPDTVAGIAIFVEAFGTVSAVEHLNRLLTKGEEWNVKQLARFIEMVVQLPADAKRTTARNLAKFLQGLPADTLQECFAIRNSFDQACNLIAHYGDSIDRENGFQRIGQILQSNITQKRRITSNHIEGYLSLADRLIWQSRHKLSLEITKCAILAGEDYSVREKYDQLFSDEKRWRHKFGCKIGLELLRGAQLDPFERLNAIPSNLLDFAASWAEEDEWMDVCGGMLDLLDDLAKLQVTFNRLSHLVLPLFISIRRGPESLARRFARTILRRIPTNKSEETVQVGQLAIRSLAFFSVQTWLSPPTKERSTEIMLSLLTSHVPDYQKWLDAICNELGAEHMVASSTCGLVPDWKKESGLANTFLASVGGLQWTETQRIKLGQMIAASWKSSPTSHQFVVEALLRLHLSEEGRDSALEFKNSRPDHPDACALLGIANAQLGNRAKALELLAEMTMHREKHGKGVRPHLTAWLHRELARTSSPLSRLRHLVCAELGTNVSLKPYETIAQAAAPSKPGPSQI